MDKSQKHHIDTVEGKHIVATAFQKSIHTKTHSQKKIKNKKKIKAKIPTYGVKYKDQKLINMKDHRL